ncbi:MAG TPA: hypothetical protein VLK85_26670 [Ramlibacter sp.]|nr:hypothetical protein [Ramlibacter sp.]
MRPLLSLVVACLAGSVAAQAPSVTTRQRGGTFHEPPAQVDPVYLPLGPDTPHPDLAQRPLTVQLALDLPLRGGGRGQGSGTQGSTAASPTLQAMLRWRPIQGSHWFGQLVFYRYLNGDRQQPWHPDFSYAFGYEHWRPGSWGLVYANYTGTRLHPDRAAGEGFSHFPQGQWTLNRKFGVPTALEPWLLVGDGDSALCVGNLHLMPRYTRQAGGAPGHWKRSLSLGCRYTRPQGWYADLALFAWPERSQQQPWDPDYTYGFGHESQWGGGTLTLRYSNYSGNRFPGRARGVGEGTFRSGSVTLSWGTEW